MIGYRPTMNTFRSGVVTLLGFALSLSSLHFPAPAHATDGSGRVIEQHWELLGDPPSGIVDATEFPILRGSVPGGSSKFDPSPTMTLEVVGRTVGTVGDAGWWVDVTTESGDPFGDSVFFGAADSEFVIKTAEMPWPESDVQLANLRVGQVVVSQGTSVPGTFDLKKAYLKIRQAGTITRTVGRVHMANRQTIADATGNWTDIADIVLYKHEANDFKPAPTIKFRAGGEVSAGTVSAELRLVTGATPVVGSTLSFPSAASSLETGALSLSNGARYKVQVRLTGSMTLFGADLVLEQETTDEHGIFQTVGWYGSVTAPLDVPAGGPTNSNFLLNAPEKSVRSSALRWLFTAKTLGANSITSVLRDRTANLDRASQTALSGGYGFFETTTVSDSPAGNDLDTATNAPSATGRISASALRIRLELRDSVPPTITNLRAEPTVFSPNGDGTLDTTLVRADLADDSPPITWTLIIKRSGTTVRSFSGSSASVDQQWDGKDSAGDVVADGVYSLILSASDAWGNSATAATTVTVKNAAITYVHDEASRLLAVVDSASDTARYIYDAAGNITSIQRQSSSTLSILEFSPNSAAPGASVSIFGTAFSTVASQNTVRFNGLPAAVQSASRTKLVVTVPSGATTGPLSVATPDGSVTASPDFIVSGSRVPQITGASPTLVMPGDAVTITGANFDAVLANNNLSLNQNRPHVPAATGTALTMTVPRYTGSGALKLSTPEGSAAGGDLFVPPYPYLPVDVGSTGRTPLGQAKAISIPTAYKVGLLIFDGLRGGRIYIKTAGSSFAQTPLMSIYNPDTSTLVGPRAAGPDLDTTVLPQTGTYTLLLDPQGTDTGSIDVTIYDVPPDFTGTIAIGGPPVTVTTTAYGQNASLTFSGVANNRLYVKYTGGTFPSNAGVYIYRPSGASIGENNVGGSQDWDTRVLPETGTYTIKIDPYNDGTGQLTVQLYDVPPDVTGTIAIGGPPVTVTTTAYGQNASLTFAGTQGDQLTLTMSGGTFSHNAGITVRKPDNGVLNDGVVGGGATWNLTQLPQTGTYSIFTDPYGDGTGQMTFSLSTTGGGGAQAPFQAPSARLRGKPDAGASATDPSVQDGAPGSKVGKAVPARRARARSSSTGPKTDRAAALTGLVLTLAGAPLSRVTLSIDDVSTRTDGKGRFLLAGLPEGRHELMIDGRTASLPGHAYGIFCAGVDIVGGRTNTLPYTIWMPELDTANEITISSPTTEEVVLTTPRIPGLEVRIPAGTVITDAEGKPVARVGITPVPLHRPPYPLPPGVEVPLYFTVQPGGAYLSSPARIIYPNYLHRPPGMRIQFWYYEPEEEGWEVYGHGHVSQDGKQVIPDPGVGIYEFTGAMINSGRIPPAVGPKDRSKDGDPVDLGTGLFVLENTDLGLSDTLPIAVQRTYRQNDLQPRSFGRGMTYSLDLFLFDPRENGQEYRKVDLVLPDGGRVRYERISPGDLWPGAIFESTSLPGRFYKSRVAWNGNGWDLTLKDGTVYVFGDSAPLRAIRDRNGNEITITRFKLPDGTDKDFIRSPHGRWLELTYSGGRIVQAADNIGRGVSYTYDLLGRMETFTDSGGGVTRYGWEPCSPDVVLEPCTRLLAITDARGNVVLTNEYFADGNVKKQTLGDTGVYEFSYVTDANGTITETRTTGPRGSVRVSVFNTDRFMVTDTRAFGLPEQQGSVLERQPGTGLVTAETDDLARRAEYTYDAMGNVKTSTRLAGRPDAVTTAMDYEPRFNLVSAITDPLQHTTSFSYDAKGNLTAVKDGLNNEFTIGPHNLDGQPLATADALQNSTSLAYDRGDLISVTDPLGRPSRRFLDAAGRLVSSVDALGNTTRSAYDALDRLRSLTDPLNQLITLEYDANGNLKKVIDPRLSETSYTYDVMDRVQSRTDPLHRTETFEYDRLGNVVIATDRRGIVNEFTYDSLDRLQLTLYGLVGAGSFRSSESSVVNTYDAGNRLIRVEDSTSGTIVSLFDDLDRLTSETSSLGTVGYAYDLAGRRTSMTVTGQAEVTYEYDNANRLTEVRQGSAAVGIGHDAAGRRTSLTLPSGIVQGYGYNAASEFTSLTYKRGATTQGDLAYGYDLAGRPITTAGTYARTGLPAAVPSATYDAANQLLSWSGTTITHDASGNMTSDGTSNFTWNARGQLTDIKQGLIPTAAFVYDGFGRRQQKTVGTSSTQYLYDGVNPVQELLASVPTANLLTGLGIDEQFVRTTVAGAVTNLLTDRLGSTLALSNSAGSVGTLYTYEPHGRTHSGPASPNPFRFTGREDDGTGLYFYRSRYHSPIFHRFISEDSAEFAAGDINLYAYAGNRPTTFSDPTGHIIPILIGVGAFLGGISYGVWQRATGHKFSWGWFAASMAIGAAVAAGAWYALQAFSSSAAVAASGAAAPTVRQITALAPRGMNLNEWGAQIWGTGVGGARAMIGARTAAQLQELGLTLDKAVMLRNFYQAAVDAGKGGAAAPVRVELLNDIIKTLGG